MGRGAPVAMSTLVDVGATVAHGGEAPAAGWRAAEWAAAVGDHVCDAYKTLAEASLDTVRKNEEALRRLHAKRDGSGAKEGEVADSAKIAAQLLLDVDALGTELAGLGVELKSESFGKLREAVRPDASAVAQLRRRSLSSRSRCNLAFPRPSLRRLISFSPAPTSS